MFDETQKQREACGAGRGCDGGGGTAVADGSETEASRLPHVRRDEAAGGEGVLADPAKQALVERGEAEILGADVHSCLKCRRCSRDRFVSEKPTCRVIETAGGIESTRVTAAMPPATLARSIGILSLYAHLATEKFERGISRSAPGQARNHEAAPRRFLDDRPSTMASDASEAAPAGRIATDRKGWLLVGSVDHAVSTANLLSRIGSATLHDLGPEESLRDVFRALPRWPEDRDFHRASRDWPPTRQRLDPVELEEEIGWLEIPPPPAVPPPPAAPPPPAVPPSVVPPPPPFASARLAGPPCAPDPAPDDAAWRERSRASGGGGALVTERVRPVGCTRGRWAALRRFAVSFRMLRSTLVTSLAAVAVLASAGAAGCSRDTAAGPRPPGPGDGGSGTDSGMMTTGALRIDPADAAITVSAGVPMSLTYRAFQRQSDGSEREVTGDVTWTSTVSGLGTFSGSVFTTTSTRGGRTNIRAQLGGAIATAVLTIRLETVLIGPGAPADAPSRFVGADDPARAPELVYPNDGVAVPPNLQELEFHYRTGGNDLFELRFQGAAVDLKVYFGCPESVGGGCIYTPDATAWETLASAAAGTGTVTYTLRGTRTSGGGVGATDTREIVFTEEPISGGLYYWNSGGRIMRFDFGLRGARAEAFLDQRRTGATTCVGCHSLARNGTRISVGLDLPTSTFQVYDIATRSRIFSLGGGGFFPSQPNFASFSPDATQIATTALTGIDIRDANTGTIVTPQLGGRGYTHPDWGPDGRRIVATRSAAPPPAIGGLYDALGVVSGSIVELVRDGSGVWTEYPLVMRTGGENNFYPAYAPDGTWVVFNRSPSNINSAGNSSDGMGPAGVPDAELWACALATPGMPVQLRNAAGYGDTWPKWDPTAYQNQGRPLFWFTWSSRREYGLRYARDARVQLWMAAFDPARGAAGMDPSYPAFRLPFQEIDSGNHIAQWVTRVERKPCIDNSMCEGGEFCSEGICLPDFI